MIKSLIVPILLFSYLSLNAQIVQPFSVYQQLTQRGDITFAANTILTCSGAGCTGAQTNTPPGSGQPATGGATAANTAWNNNSYTMNYIDADGTPAFAGKTTFSSSRAFLDLSSNPGCSVIEAYLTWGGNILTSTTNFAKRDSVYLKTPNNVNYKGYKADFTIDNTAGATVAGFPAGTQVTYQCYKKITPDVRSAGEGDYWVGNVVANTGIANMCGGWAIVVIYGDANFPLRNLTIYKGYANVDATAGGQNIGISGFFTPPNPISAVNVKLGVYSFEGDQGTIGDSLKFNGLAVSNTKNFQNNFFNSSITQADTNCARFPLLVNTLGYDADIVTLANTTKNYLANGASSATIRLTTAGDQYWPFMISTAIDVFEPNVFATKDWVDDNGGLVQLGDTITYNLKVYNKGTDPAINVEVVDSLIGAMNYVPNSSKILTGANASAIVKTDMIGDDQVDVNGNIIKFRLGGGANGTNGGSMGITAATDSVTTFTFKVKITNDCQIFHCSGDVKNLAYINYTGLSSGQSRSTLSSANGLDAFGCPIQGATGFTVVVPPCTPIPDTTIVDCDPFILSKITVNRPGFTNFYNSSFTTVSNATTTGTYYATKDLIPGCSDTISIFFTSTGSCPILPVILKDIFATYNNGISTVKWITTNANNTQKFIIERSTNAINFEPIGFVNANQNGFNENTYQFFDNTLPSSKKVYYRIKIIDYDGSFKISNIVFVNTLKTTAQIEIIQIVPNPIVNEAVVKLFCKNKGTYSYKIINDLGQIVIYNNVNCIEGNNDIKLNRRNLNGGVYIIKINNTNFSVIKKIVINN